MTNKNETNEQVNRDKEKLRSHSVVQAAIRSRLVWIIVSPQRLFPSIIRHHLSLRDVDVDHGACATRPFILELPRPVVVRAVPSKTGIFWDYTVTYWWKYEMCVQPANRDFKETPSYKLVFIYMSGAQGEAGVCLEWELECHWPLPPSPPNLKLTLCKSVLGPFMPLHFKSPVNSPGYLLDV